MASSSAWHNPEAYTPIAEHPTPAKLWIGRILGGVAAAALLVDAGMKIAQTQGAVDMLVALGYPAATVMPIGIALLTSVVLYIIPQTSVFGAALLTAYLGGAVASHVRAGQGPMEFAPAIVMALMIWFGLRFCEPRLAAITPRRWT